MGEANLNGTVSGVGSIVGTVTNYSFQYPAIDGEKHLKDIPIGVSYASKDMTLKYEVNNFGDIDSFDVESGSCIIKTIGQVEVEGYDYVVDGGVTVYVIPRTNKLIMYKIVPVHTDTGETYYENFTIECQATLEAMHSIDPDTDWSDFPYSVPSVYAMTKYVAENAGSGGGGGGGSPNAVLYTKQTLNASQKAQARANIGVDEYIEQTILGGAW